MNKMKKKQKTYADVAKEIKNRYTRSGWDPIERADMEKELRELKEKQEQARASMGVGEGEQEEQGSGEQQFATGGELDGFNKYGYVDRSTLGFENVKSANSGAPMPNLFDFKDYGIPSGLTSSAMMNELQFKDYGIKPGPTSSNGTDGYDSMTNSIWPTAISAASSLIGDFAGMRNANKNMPRSVALPRIVSSNISLEPQRNALQRSYNTANNVMLRNSRDVGSPANAYANQIAGMSALTDSLGTQMGQSYMNEANTNAQMNQQVNIRNADIGSQEAMQNVQIKLNRVNTQNQYINSLSQTVPSALRDYRQQNNDTNMMNIMGKDYGLYQKYNPNMSFSDKIRMGILGPHYSIQNREYANQNLRG